MALIGTIRKNGWILIATMALALGGFILMDVISNSQRYQAGDVNTLGKVNGTEIKYNDFETYRQLIYSKPDGNDFQVRTQVWTYFMEEALMKDEAEKAGIGVSKDELVDLQFGNNLSPVINDRFKGADGQVNRATLASIKSAIESGDFTDPTNRAYWATQEKEIIKERLQEKLTNLAVKAVYTPSWLAEMTFRENNDRINFTYVRIPYDKVQDNEIQITDADYSAYLKDFPHLYDQPEEVRVVDYVVVDVLPTSGDSLAARDVVAKLVEDLRASTNDSVFAATHSGVLEDSYKKKTFLPATVADTLLRLPLGSVVGPYLDGGSWGIAKILDRKVVPDSVRARHILLQSGTPNAEKTIDSLMGLLSAGKARFDSLAAKFSTDRSNADKGGDLGWFAEGMMVPEFNNVCFYKAEPGKFYKVQTQFGWHLIELLGKKTIKNESGVKALYVSQTIEPSKNTQQTAEDRAASLAQQAKTPEDLKTIAGQQGLQAISSPPVKANDYIFANLGSGDDAREIVRWAFNEKTKAGSVSKEIFAFRDPNGGYFESKYVVTALKAIAPKGAASIATLKNIPRVESEIKVRKKAEVIKGKIQNAGDLSAVASQWGVAVDTAKNASMMQTFLQAGGSEPRVFGAAFSLAKEAVSSPVAGNSGVYIVRPISDKPQSDLPPDLTLFRRQVNSTALSAIRMNFINAVKKAADVQDNRSRFF